MPLWQPNAGLFQQPGASGYAFPGPAQQAWWAHAQDHSPVTALGGQGYGEPGGRSARATPPQTPQPSALQNANPYLTGPEQGATTSANPWLANEDAMQGLWNDELWGGGEDLWGGAGLWSAKGDAPKGTLQKRLTRMSDLYSNFGPDAPTSGG